MTRWAARSVPEKDGSHGPCFPGRAEGTGPAGENALCWNQTAFRLNRAEHARWCDERGAVAKRVTITDVARETGVSIKTVSNVLNNTGSMRPETRQRVQDAIERLGYRVNVSARAMKTGGTKLIGLAITDFCQPFMPYLADSIVAAARSRGYAVITDTYNSAGGLAQAIPETKKLAADGWIFFMGSPITDRTILHQPYPLVIVGDYDTQGLADWVTMPNVEAVRTAVGALLDSGCRRIALIGGTAENACPDADRESRPETTSTMRTRGYVLAHEERGLQVDWRLVRNADWVQSGGRDAVAGLLDDPDAPRPDAVMCLNDALAIGVIHELQRRGVRVPQDMQVIGFDNVPDAEYCMPGLTTIDPHVDDYARHAVDMLIARIEGSADPFRTYVTSYDLVRRASTC